MRNVEILFPAALLLFVAAFIALGSLWLNYSMTVMRFPLLIGAVTAGLCLIQLAIAAATPSADDEGNKGTFGSVARRAAWIAGVLPAVWLLGYPAGLSFYIFAYLKAQGESWRKASIFCLVTFAVIYGIFVKALGMALPVMPAIWT